MIDYSDVKSIHLDLDVVREYLSQATPESHVYVGCDAATNKENTITTYTRTVVIRKRVGDIFKGCKIFGESFVERSYGLSGMSARLMQEVYYAAEAAEAIRDVAENKFDVFTVDLDLNKDPEHRSNTVVAQAIGYIQALGLTPRIKPDAHAATGAAHSFNKIVNRMRNSA
jgi:predicted RNase H-related nuclease YkuK (DUF458 family)